jgi:hypothetical protein
MLDQLLNHLVGVAELRQPEGVAQVSAISGRLENPGKDKCAILHRRRLARVARMSEDAIVLSLHCTPRQSGGAGIAVSVRRDFHAGHQQDSVGTNLPALFAA